MDLEALLREQLRVNPERPVRAMLWQNNERRIVATLYDASTFIGEYVVFGNNVAEYTIPAVAEKPPTQRVSIPGLDSFMPMGGRK